MSGLAGLGAILIILALLAFLVASGCREDGVTLR